MASPVDDAIRAALERVLPDAAVPRELAFRPLAGGLNARSFVVAAGERELVVRLPLGGAPPLLDLATEAAVMRAAAKQGLAPAVVGADVPSGVLVTELRTAAVAWTIDAAREPRNIARLAQLLRTLHAIAAPAPRFSAGAIAARYLADVRAAGAAERAWQAELLERAYEFDACHPGDALCHNDLFAANVLDDGRLMLVDFEFAVRAAPLLDLAGFAAMNELAPEQRRTLLAEYYRGAEPPLASELDRAMRMVRLLAYFWALLGQRHAASPGAYTELGASIAKMLHEDRV